MVLYSKVTTAPNYLDVVTLTEAKQHLRVTGTSDDTYITTLISVAGSLCESYAGRSFTDQTREVRLDKFPCDSGEIILPYGPVQTVDEFSYIDTDDDDQLLVENTHFRLDVHSDLARLKPINGWPGADTVMNALIIEYTAGYVTGEIPAQIKQAMLMQIGTFFENRQDEITGTIVAGLSWSSKALLDTIKVYWYAGQD
jgi:uncharacterized phiE125 gp8 family phage protein